MSILQIDFETRSECDLKNEGAYRYATDASTGIYCMGWAFDDEPVETWIPGHPFPDRILAHVVGRGIITAWNAQFERLIWKYVLGPDYGLPIPELRQYQCTAARARAHGMPGRLGECSRAMGAAFQKMDEGTRLIREYCAKNVPWEDIPAGDQILMREYCRKDVETERAIGDSLRELSEYEWEEFHITEEINDRGVPLDLAFAREAAAYADEIRLAADGRIKKLTGGLVKTARERKSRDAWVLPRLTVEQRKSLQTHKLATQDAEKYSFTETHRSALLADADLDLEVRRYLELVDEAGGASLRKYTSMLNREIDGRLHGALIFNGAGQTGRFSSTGLQAHNLKRTDLENIDELVQVILDGYEFHEARDGDPSDLLGQLVRSTIYNPGGLSWFDWSSIEGRVAPWLANSREGRAKLQLYRDGIDPYIYNASRTFNVPMEEVTKTQRQAGKLQELALQFLGGVGALKLMGINYGMKIEDAEGEMLRDAWRIANPWAQKFGRELEGAAMRAMNHPGEWMPAGLVAYAYDGEQWLWCKLPSGRLIAYYQPRMDWVETPWGEERAAITCVWGAAKPKVGDTWPRRAMHGGLFIENVTQGTAGCLLRGAVVRGHQAGLPIVLHVHDEIVVEGNCQEELGQVMLDLPAWARGLPVQGSGGSGLRYGK